MLKVPGDQEPSLPIGRSLFGMAATRVRQGGQLPRMRRSPGSLTGWVLDRHANGRRLHTFEDARLYSSLPAIGSEPARPVIGIVPTADQNGYWLIGSDGIWGAGFVDHCPGSLEPCQISEVQFLTSR